MFQTVAEISTVIEGFPPTSTEACPWYVPGRVSAGIKMVTKMDCRTERGIRIPELGIESRGSERQPPPLPKLMRGRKVK
jgi:hypothetical protein